MTSERMMKTTMKVAATINRLLSDVKTVNLIMIVIIIDAKAA